MKITLQKGKNKGRKQEEKTESKRRKTLERELEWVRMSPTGRRTKSKSRLSNYEKLLGVIIDNNLNFNEHVTRLCKKASQKLHALARVSRFMNMEK